MAVINDPIADMLTRIRNGLIARHDAVTIPASNMKKSIAKILLDEGYIKSVDYIDDGLQGQIKVTLKYAAGKESVIKGLKRISKPFSKPLVTPVTMLLIRDRYKPCIERWGLLSDGRDTMISVPTCSTLISLLTF